MIASRPLPQQVVLAVAAVLVGVMLFLAGFLAGSAGGSPMRDEAQARPFPDWFLPIWDSYDRNPAVTPAFDFAGLYSPGPAPMSRAPH